MVKFLGIGKNITTIFFIVVPPSTFEDAINAAGFGKFNIGLLCLIILGAFAQVTEKSGLSYIIPIAECDLALTLEDKGVLVSSTYIGKYFLL